LLKLPVSTALTLFLVSSAEAQRPTPRPSTDPWEVTTSRSEKTGQPSVALELAALNTASGPVFEVRPVLLVRCQENELEVFVATGSVLDSDDSVMTPVRIHWGTQAAEETRWSRSMDYTSAFAPDPQKFLRRLVSTPDLRLEVRTSNRSPQLIRFNARGLERHMPKVEAACPPDGQLPDHVFREDMVDERPQILSAPALDYPPLLRHAGLQGRVIVQAVIDTLGRAEPGSLKVIARPNAGFEQSARDYILHAVFRPARLKGRAVRVLMRIPIDYKIN
jgi:TonB family protein